MLMQNIQKVLLEPIRLSIVTSPSEAKVKLGEKKAILSMMRPLQHHSDTYSYT